jgi:hypothetical protein
MKAFWNNLRPLEKRLVFGVGVFFLVLANFWIIVPHFSDWAAVQARRDKALRTLDVYNKELSKKGNIELLIRQLEGEGLAVPAEEQQTHFATAIQNQAAQSQVSINQSGRQQVKTNQFFLEVSQTIAVQSKESQLVDFLYNLGVGNSLVRVRDLRLRPDPPRQQLQADIKLAASYQKKAAPRVVTAPGAKTPVSPTPTNKPPAPKPSPTPAPTTTTTTTSPKTGPATKPPANPPVQPGQTNRPKFNLKKT